MKGVPMTMQNKPKYKNVLLDIYDYLKKIHTLRSLGINHKHNTGSGIGFGKNMQHNIN